MTTEHESEWIIGTPVRLDSVTPTPMKSSVHIKSPILDEADAIVRAGEFSKATDWKDTGDGAHVSPERFQRSAETYYGVTDTLNESPVSLPDTVAPFPKTGGKSLSLVWITAIAVLIVALIGLLVISELIQIVTAIRTAPTVLRFSAYGLMILAGSSIVWALGQLLILWYSLPRMLQVRLADLTADRGLQAQSEAHKEQLTRFVKQYPVNTTGSTTLSTVFTTEQLAYLRQTQRRLSNDALSPGTRGWLQDYLQHFQGTLDTVARGLILRTARNVAWKTAASPYPILDFAIVMYSQFNLFRQLCIVYQLRLSTAQLIISVGRIFMMSFLAKTLNQVEDLTDQLLDNGHDAINALAGRLLAKSAVAYFNYRQSQRMGMRFMEQIQPAKP